MREKTLFAATDFVKIRSALDKLRFRAVVHGVHGVLAWLISIAPERGGAVLAVFIQRIEVDVEGGQLLFVVVVIARHAGHGFEAGVLRRHPFAHHFNNGVAAADFDVFFTFARRAGGAYFVIDVTAGTDDGGVANAAGNLPGEPGGSGGRRDVALFIYRHARNRAGGRMRDYPLRVSKQRLVFRRVLKNAGQLLFQLVFPLRAVDARPPVERSRRFPCEPDFARMLGEEIHLLESFVHREAPSAIAHDHHLIGALHHRFRETRNIFDAPDGSDRARAVRGPVHHAGIEFHFALLVGQPAVSDGVIIGIVFDDGDRSYDGVQRVATFLENVYAAPQRVHSVCTGDDEWAFALSRRRRPTIPIARAGRKIASRRCRRRTFEQIGYARGSTPGKRSKKKFTA